MVGLWKGTDQARNHGMIANGFILTHCHNRSAHLIAGQTTSTRRIFEVLHLRDYKVVVLLSTMQQGIFSMEIKYCVAAVKASWSQGALSPRICNWYNWSVTMALFALTLRRRKYQSSTACKSWKALLIVSQIHTSCYWVFSSDLA